MNKPSLSLEDALEKILACVPQAVSERISASNAVGRFLIASPLAKANIPTFDNSAMDGYAVRSADTRGASKETPVVLQLCGRVETGDVFQGELAAGECIRIFTGGPLPKGADAVVMQEDTELLTLKESEVRILDEIKPWENIRLLGEDVRKDKPLGNPGEAMTPALIALMLATGVDRLEVGHRLVVGILATGSELVEPGCELPPGKIFESNRAMIAALAQQAGAETVVYPIVKDSLDETRNALKSAFEHCDMVVTSGGVSVGEMDFVKPAFEELGGTLEFWKLAIKPGRPFVFGRWGGKLLMGLPGNPVSAFVTFLLLVRPALLKWQGAGKLGLSIQTGRVGEAIHNSGERRHFLRVRMDASGNVRPAGVQASHILSSLAASNGLVDMPANSRLDVGKPVKVLRYS